MKTNMQHEFFIGHRHEASFIHG